MIASAIIIEYLSKKFEGIGKFSANDREFLIPSIFRPVDRRLKLSINTETGLWQDFVSGESGNFVMLYAKIENKSYHAAEAELLIRSLFKNDTKKLPKVKEDLEKKNPLSDSLEKVSVSSYDSDDELVQKAWCFLFERKLMDLEEDRFVYYLERSGKYKDRLIIPFIKNDALYYFQARALNDQYPKYLNPPIEEGVKPSHILYPFEEEAESVVVCEGPLDAISLQIQGVNATCTMGCHTSEEQMNILKDFPGKIILGYDNDEAGRVGIEKFDRLRKCKMMPEISICPPPNPYKDWNEAHVKEEDLKTWVKEKSILYDYAFRINSSLHIY